MNFLNKLDVLPVSVAMNYVEINSHLFSVHRILFQDMYCSSVAQFMAHVHSQVNSMSRLYLQNERRYNYTTPKSFLEQISLYSKLLIQKSNELSGKIDRLQNGLEKLKTTAKQVVPIQYYRDLKTVEFY